MEDTEELIQPLIPGRKEEKKGFFGSLFGKWKSDSSSKYRCDS